MKRFWRNRLYSKVQIKVDKIAGDKAWLTIDLKQQPRMSELRFTGVKGGEKKDIEKDLGMVEGQQITPNIVAQMKQLIERYYSKKGFKNAKVEIREIPDLSKENHVMLQVDVDRSNKIKVHKIYINGNKVMSDSKVKRAMKKTNENGNLLNLFKQKKFVEQDFADDLNRIVEKYNELGYRDAKILNDSVARYNDKSVDVFIDLEEGDKYYISDIQWVGNTVYDTDVLNKYDKNNMKDTEYRLFLDQYGYLAGIEIIDEPDQYVLLTGLNTNAGNLSNETADGRVIFMDGSSEVVKINMNKSKSADGTSLATKTTGNSTRNTWCEYSVNSNNVYTLTEVPNT